MDGSNTTRYRVYNRCKYAIGVTLLNGQSINIRPGSFQMLTSDDIAYIDGICRDRKFFTEKMLVPCDANGKEIALEAVGMLPDMEAKQHLSDEVIEGALKQSYKKLESWLDEVTDPAELHAVYEVASRMDLPASKLKLLAARMPEKDWLDQME